jgi:hypothetical protein
VAIAGIFLFVLFLTVLLLMKKRKQNSRPTN